MLAEMARDVAAARALTREAAAAEDRGEHADAGGLVAGQVDGLRHRDAGRDGRRPAVRCDAGYSRETGIERLMRDAKGAQIYEGTNQIHREIVAAAALDERR